MHSPATNARTCTSNASPVTRRGRGDADPGPAPAALRGEVRGDCLGDRCFPTARLRDLAATRMLSSARCSSARSLASRASSFSTSCSSRRRVALLPADPGVPPPAPPLAPPSLARVGRAAERGRRRGRSWCWAKGEDETAATALAAAAAAAEYRCWRRTAAAFSDSVVTCGRGDEEADGTDGGDAAPAERGVWAWCCGDGGAGVRPASTLSP